MSPRPVGFCHLALLPTLSGPALGFSSADFTGSLESGGSITLCLELRVVLTLAKSQVGFISASDPAR